MSFAPNWREPAITINGHDLTFTQAATVRAAVNIFLLQLQNDDFGDDDEGKVKEVYKRTAAFLVDLMEPT